MDIHGWVNRVDFTGSLGVAGKRMGEDQIWGKLGRGRACRKKRLEFEILGVLKGWYVNLVQWKLYGIYKSKPSEGF